MANEWTFARAAAVWRRKMIGGMIAMAAVLFGCSGNPRWTAGWLLWLLAAGSQVLLYRVLLRASPELLVERSRIGPGTKQWDKPLVMLMAAVLPMLGWIIAAFDERFQWSKLPAWCAWIAFPFAIAGSGLIIWAMASNRFFAVTVRIQNERGHTVVEGGPYSHIRHPGYAGAIAFTLASPFALGSGWALVPATACVAVTVLRTALEDRTLRSELPGYGEYAGRVRWRLVTGVW